MKLRTAILTGLLGFNCLALAANSTRNVDVKVEDGMGKVIIIQDVNGEKKTIKESFSVGNDTDIDTEIAAIMSAHGIDHDNKEIHKKVIKLGDHGHNKMVWVQKSSDIDIDLVSGNATVVIKKDNNGDVEIIEKIFKVDDNTDINQLVDDLMAEHGIKAGGAELHRKVIKLDKRFAQIDNDKPRMGFMANVQDNGWAIVSVVPDSGAAEGGLQKGDVVISIDGQSTAKEGLGLTEFITIDKQVGDVSQVIVLRDKQQISLQIEAKVIDSPDIIMEMNGGGNWFTSSGNDFKFSSGDLDSMFNGLHVEVENLDKMVEGFGDRQIHVVTTADVDAYFFSGSKMNQWLGKNHHFSTVTESLGKYFGTTQGVLVLEVDQDNKLGLKDGDIIQAINGEDVASPKDVVRIMSGFKSDESFEIEIIREKETIYLES